MTLGAPVTVVEFASSESSAADLPGEARGRYVASLGGDSWSVVIGRRWLAVSADGAHVRSRYRVDELDGGTRITTIPTSRDEGPIEVWWLVTGGQRRYLVRDVARAPFCLEVATAIERGDAYGAVRGIDDEDLFVTTAIGGPIARAPTVLALARILTPLPVGTVVDLHGGEVVCPERATEAAP